VSEVLVVGDIILDEYWYGHSTRISPEAPVPVVVKDSVEFKLGGAANVALSVQTLGTTVYLSGVVGKDEAHKSIKKLLNKKKLDFNLLEDQLAPTTQKLRILANQHYIGRVDTEQKFNISVKDLIKTLPKELPEFCILSDYDKGTLSGVKELIAFLKKKKCKVFIDPKQNFEVYRGAYLLKPNKKEFIDFFGSFKDLKELEQKSKQVIKSFDIEYLLITLGSEGMVLVSKNQFLHLPSAALDVFDVTGAGDTVIATLVSFISKGASIEDSVEMANRAAAISVSRKGVYNVTLADLSLMQRSLNP
jgi:rfaE bifunctional protein kinase chain/domain